MNRHLAIKTSCFCVLELRNSPAITCIPRLESEHFNHNLFDPDLIRGSLGLKNSIAELKAAEAKFSEQLALTEKERLAKEAKTRAVKQQFETVQAMFNKQEANVYLQRQNVLISAHGFQFPSGVSEIQTANFPLMNKIIRAIKLLPKARIEVTGHTDSTGADNVNQALSQSRAEKVGKFLTEVGEIPANRIVASGYGESRPVASNKTEAGRAENRRVEIRIINE